MILGKPKAIPINLSKNKIRNKIGGVVLKGH